MKILVVDDDADISNLLKRFLEARGRRVQTASDGLQALESFRKEAPDLVILDVMLPGMDGWSVLGKIREQSNTPVLMLTGKDTPGDAAKGLLSGADDYIPKPFDLAELEARISAVMRRSQTVKTAPTQLQVGPLSIDDKNKQVRLGEQEIALSPREYDLLKLLASEPGRVFSDEDIIKNVWPAGSSASSTDVKRYIYLLRKKIEQNPQEAKLIQTVPGFGYRLAV
jgi:DNA-binding response OmpR family regulator